MKNNHPRMIRERRTIEQMAFLYCEKQLQSQPGELCAGCQALIDYAFQRLDRCPFQENKPTCAKCTIHCYKPDMREQVRRMMRYAGPRMLLHHPWLAILHLADGFRKPPVLSRKH